MKTFAPTVVWLATSTTLLAAAESVEVNATDSHPSRELSTGDTSTWFTSYVRLGGTDLPNYPAEVVPDQLDCISKCRSIEGCYGVNHDGLICDLKGWDTLYAPGTPTTDYIFSAMLVPRDFPLPEPYYKFIDNCDLAGGDVGSHPGTDVHDCARQCHQKKAQCGRVTWSNYNGGTCWYKYNAHQPCTSKEGVSSALLFGKRDPDI